jgi:hypothetical protein
MKPFGKFHLVGLIVLLYALIVSIALLTNQPVQVMSMVLDKGAPGIGLICFFILLFG